MERAQYSRMHKLLFMWIALLGISGWISEPGLQQTQYPVVFSILLCCHIVGYALIFRFPTRWYGLIGYFTVQSVLVFAIGLVTPFTTMALGLYLALISQAIGFVLQTWVLGILVVLYLFCYALLVGLMSGWDLALHTPLFAVPLVFLVITYMTMVVRQTQGHEQARTLLGELEVAHQQLAEFAEQVEDLTLATERQRMARELHDTLAQGLAGLILQLEAVNAHLAQGRLDRSQEIVQQAMIRARDTLTDSRRAIDDLRMGNTNANELIATIKQRIHHFTTTTGIPCTLDLRLHRGLPELISEHLLRGLTESLTNIERHSQARQVRILIVEERGMVVLEVQDDGVGFNPELIQHHKGHYGLLGLSERAHLTSGIIDVISTPLQGTTIRLQLPLAQEKVLP